MMVAVEEMISGGFGGTGRLGAGAVDGSFGESENRLNREREVLTKHNDEFFISHLQGRLGRESEEDE